MLSVQNLYGATEKLAKCVKYILSHSGKRTHTHTPNTHDGHKTNLYAYELNHHHRSAFGRGLLQVLGLQCAEIAP